MTEKNIIQTRKDILKSALNARVEEVMLYQININNYTRALEKIAALNADERSELSDFANKLSSLLASERLEQKKAQIMLDVLKEQVE